MAKENTKNDSTTNNDCFVIMPIADPEGYEKGHFKKVYEDLFKVACEKSGFHAIRADEVQQTNLIHLDILKKLIASPMAICDLSSRNPNVLFELGLRQAFDKPTVLVQECGTPKIFDISILRYTEYRKELKYREVLDDQELIAKAIKSTKIATADSEGINSIINLLSISSPATLKDVTDDNHSAKIMQILISEMNELKTELRHTLRRPDEREIQSNEYISRVEIEFDKSRMDLRKLHKYVMTGSSIEIIKELYDRLQNRLIWLIDSPISITRREQVKDMLTETEHIFALQASKKG